MKPQLRLAFQYGDGVVDLQADGNIMTADRCSADWEHAQP
jgi:hypothetical protein